MQSTVESQLVCLVRGHLCMYLYLMGRSRDIKACSPRFQVYSHSSHTHAALAIYIQSRNTFSITMSYNSLLLIPASNVASPIVTPVIPIGSPMVVQLQVEAAPSPSLYLSRTSSHESLLHRPSSSQSFPQPNLALYLPQLSSAQPPPHPSSFLCLPQPPSIPVPAVIHASPISEACIPVVPSQTAVSAHVVGHSIGFPSRCPLCSSNSSNNRAKVGFKRRLQRLLGGQW